MDKFRYEGLCCPVCNAKLFDDDDIAVCPICGAPHHRDCFNYEGHCHFESTHGTPEQWTMPKEDTQKSNFENENQQGFENFNPQQFYNSNQQTEQQIPNIISFCAATLEEDIDEDIKGKDVIHFVYLLSCSYDLDAVPAGEKTPDDHFVHAHRSGNLPFGCPDELPAAGFVLWGRVQHLCCYSYRHAPCGRAFKGTADHLFRLCHLP